MSAGFSGHLVRSVDSFGIEHIRFNPVLAGDLNAPWFQSFGHFTRQVDMQHSIGVAGSRDPNMIILPLAYILGSIKLMI